MAFVTISANDAFNTVASLTTGKTRAITLPFNVNGLLPLSPYTFWYNNNDASWSCRPYGGRLGDPLITDASGNLTFDWFAEVNNGMAGAASYTSYNQFQLRDINNISKALMILPQNIVVRT